MEHISYILMYAAPITVLVYAGLVVLSALSLRSARSNSHAAVNGRYRFLFDAVSATSTDACKVDDEGRCANVTTNTANLA